MKKIVSFFLILFISLSVFAQTEEPVDKKADRKKAKQEKKEEEQKMRESMAILTKQMIEEQKFVMEAIYLNSRGGDMISVSPELNFIIIDTTYGMIQLGTLDGTGFGTQGTLTFDGEVTRYDVHRTEKKNYTAWDVMIVIFSNIGTYDISLSISDDGTGEATISGSGAGSVTSTGRLYPHEASNIFKGQKLY